MKLAVFGDVDISWHYQQGVVDSRGGARSLSLRSWSGSATLGSAGTLALQAMEVQKVVAGIKVVHPYTRGLEPRLERETILPVVSHRVEIVEQVKAKKGDKVLRVVDALGWAPAKRTEYIAQLKGWAGKAKDSFKHADTYLLNDAAWGFSSDYLKALQSHKPEPYRQILTKTYPDLGIRNDSWIVLKARLMPPMNWQEDGVDPLDEISEEIKKQVPSLAVDQRLILCVAVDDLRTAGLEVSQGISWERTLQHLAEAAKGPSPFKQACCIPGILEARFVLINLSIDALLLIDRGIDGNSVTLLHAFHPPFIEGDSSKLREGKIFAANSWAATLISSYLTKNPCEPKDLLKNLRDYHILTGTLGVLYECAHLGINAAGSNALGTLTFGKKITTGDSKEGLVGWNHGTAFDLLLATIANRADVRHLKKHLIGQANIRQFKLNWSKVGIEKRLNTAGESDLALVKADHFRKTWWTLLGELLDGNNAKDFATKKLDEKYFIYARKVLEFGGSGEKEYLPDILNCPYGRFGDFVTVDRAEIESFRNLASVIEEYMKLPTTKPLNIAVFGPPGSGKSFGVKQLVNSLSLGREVEFPTFNLSQFDSISALPGCFQIIQDIVLAGRLPVVFWDEFDTTLNSTPFGWLHAFLAPMQDGEFVHNNRSNPIGKCIFVFAGSRFDSFGDLPDPGSAVERPREEVISLSLKEAEEESRIRKNGKASEYEQERVRRLNLLRRQENWRQAKGHDFRSRLKAYLDVREPNADKIYDRGEFLKFDRTDPRTCDQLAFLVRRARMLRSWLYQAYPTLFARESGSSTPGGRTYERLKISLPILRGFLSPSKFTHGSRSMESVLYTSTLQGQPSYERSAIPPAAVVGIHIDPSAFEVSDDKTFPEYEVEALKKRLVPDILFAGPSPEVTLFVSEPAPGRNYLVATWEDAVNTGNALPTHDGLEFLIGNATATDDTPASFAIHVRDDASPHAVSLSAEQCKKLGLTTAGMVKVAVRLYAGEDRSEAKVIYTAQYDPSTQKWSNLQRA